MCFAHTDIIILITVSFLNAQIGDGTQEDIPNSASEYPGKMITADQVKCDLPESPLSINTTMAAETAHAFRIAISNDGQAYSQSHVLTIYDPKCMTCQAGGICQLKVIYDKMHNGNVSIACNLSNVQIVQECVMYDS